MRDTSEHERQVAVIVGRMGELYGLEEESLMELRLAALVHDIGKIGIPPEILHKPGPLTDDEYAVVKSHSILGWRLIEFAGYRRVAGWVRHHHERWDGTGYPDRLRGTETPVQARLIAIADTYEALTADHTYRNPVTRDEAIAVIEAGAGTQFDPALIPLLAVSLVVEEELT